MIQNGTLASLMIIFYQMRECFLLHKVSKKFIFISKHESYEDVCMFMN